MMTDQPGREVPKEYRPVIKAAIEQGFRYDTSGKGHPRLFPADKSKAIITIAGTPSDKRRGLQNLVADIRRAGGKV